MLTFVNQARERDRERGGEKEREREIEGWRDGEIVIGDRERETEKKGDF